MRKLPTIAFAGVAAAALAGAAVAASRNNHVMEVPLPDGSAVQVEYVGNVAPKITVEPARAVGEADWVPLPSFAGFDRMFQDMDRQTEALLRQAQQMARMPAGVPGAPIAVSFGNAPTGVASSTTIVSYSNGSGVCTRRTDSVSQGPGKPPKVTTAVSGNCGSAPAATAPSAAPVNRT